MFNKNPSGLDFILDCFRRNAARFPMELDEAARTSYPRRVDGDDLTADHHLFFSPENLHSRCRHYGN